MFLRSGHEKSRLEGERAKAEDSQKLGCRGRTVRVTGAGGNTAIKERFVKM